MGNPDTDSAPTVYHAGPPTLEGWMAFYRTPEMRPEDVVGAVHIRPGADFTAVKTAWAMNELDAASSVFDGLVHIRFGPDAPSLDQVRAEMWAIELRSHLRSQNAGTVPGPPDSHAPKAPPTTTGTGRRASGPPAGAAAGARATAPKQGPRPGPSGQSQGHRAGSPRGSRKGRDGGNLDNSPLLFVAGLVKSGIDAIGELAFMGYDALGATWGKLDADYRHNYISLAGQAIVEQGASLGDLIEGAVQGATDSTVDTLRDLARGDYFASGTEAAGTPFVAGVTGGAGMAGTTKTLTGAARALTTRRAGKPGITGPKIASRTIDDSTGNAGKLAPEDWRDVTRDLGLDAPGSHAGRPRMPRADEIADAVRAAREQGWVGADGGGLGSVGGGFQKHADKAVVRRALSLADDTYESAHLGASGFFRGVDSYSRANALTQLMPKSLHRGTRNTGNLRGYDPYWKRWLQLQHRKGQSQITLREAMDAEFRALDQAGGAFNPNRPLSGPGTDWMTPRRRDTLQWQMRREYMETAAKAGLDLNHRIETPMKPRAKKSK